MHHCPECRRPYRPSVDVCPDCWVALVDGAPPPSGRLELVYETSAVYEADMIEALLREEDIACLRMPAHGALPGSLVGAIVLPGLQIYVRAEVASLARELIAEVTGGSEAPEENERGPE